MASITIIGAIVGIGGIGLLLFLGLRRLYKKGRSDERKDIELKSEKQINRHMQDQMEKVIEIDNAIPRIKRFLGLRGSKSSSQSSKVSSAKRVSNNKVVVKNRTKAKKT